MIIRTHKIICNEIRAKKMDFELDWIGFVEPKVSRIKLPISKNRHEIGNMMRC